jgi:hypothetical protein
MIADQVNWIAPGFGNGDQVAVVGIGTPRAQTQYSDSDLDLLAEAADRIGTIVYLHQLHPLGPENLLQMTSAIHHYEDDLRAGSQALISTLEGNPAPQFVKEVEACLRKMNDYNTLGQSVLTGKLNIPGTTHIEKGKTMRQLLVEAIEMLRPAEERPAEPLPREWYSYAILHDAYMESVPNREIMARLYISEGTFNRNRQKALRGIARHLMEKISDQSRMLE